MPPTPQYRPHACRFHTADALSYNRAGELTEYDSMSATGQRDGTLTLVFRGGSKIRVFDSSERYESYLIRVGEKVIVV